MRIWLVLLLALAGITSIHGENCSETGEIRLVQTTSINLTNAGRVEICMDGTWGTIAADSIGTPWSEKNAQVACIQRNFDGALNSIFHRTLPFAERSMSPIHINAVRCDGTERRIIDCPYSNSTQNVDHGFDVYVVCRPKNSRYSVVHPGGGPQSGDIRLFGDVRNGRGAVQIYTTTLGWQGVCPDSSWTDSDAVIVCQDLGYQSGSIASPVNSLSGPDGQPSSRQLYNAECPGRSADDVTTGVCSFSIQSSPSGNCPFPDGTFAAVQCSSVMDQSVRLIGGSHFQEGIVEIAYNGRWGMVCDDGFSTTDARSICQGLGFGTDEASMVSPSSRSFLEAESNLRPIWLTELECTSSDSNLPACILEENIIGYANCRTSGRSVAAIDCGDPPPLTPGQTAGVVIGVLVFLAIAIPLLVICLDENKKKATLAKLSACRTRLSNVRLPRPKLRVRSRRRPQPQPQPPPPAQLPPQPQPPSVTPVTPAVSTPAASAEPSAPQLSPPEPTQSKSEAASSNEPPISKVPLPDSELSKANDEPPPYPGGPGPAYPPPFAATIDFQGYPPPWTDPAYPSPVEVPHT